MNNDLSVGPSPKGVTLAQQKCSQLLEIVDFAVEYDPEGTILVRQRLMPSVQVYDGEPPMTQTHLTSNIDPFVVGAAMTNRIQHPTNQSWIHNIVPLEIKPSADSAHGRFVRDQR
jgi:hypothetical protein